TGSLRGRNLDTLGGDEITRPTTQATKEALFSSIQFEIEDKKVLDLFAGSGQLGIEALSRGARSCTFVESNKSAYKIVESNLDRCKIADKATLVFSEAKSFLMKKDNFDIAFLDPPYHKGLITDCLPMLTALMNEDGVIICETANDEELLQEVNGWLISKQKKYGKTKLTYYRKG
ncbi:16S rRNA (guanine(966)-N(2))-methyltransferase RsmD, partial [Eubacterium sp.]|uniref:16S rRNA (guanine(966)-N(2))-methyltransferase RsmD n=1 Tax=Eubacterium sp. TaxID=142586 RepID=UPI003F006A48